MPPTTRPGRFEVVEPPADPNIHVPQPPVAPTPSRRIRHIAVTGGPCAGKSTGLTTAAERLRSSGWRVLVVPEAATLVIGAGIYDLPHLATSTPEKVRAVQRTVLRIQRSFAESFEGLAEALDDDRTVVLYDRAEPDGAAYVGAEYLATLAGEFDTTVTELRDRFDAALHLTTAADGAESAYTLDTNHTRSESPERARELDRATLQAWLGHSHHRVINNDGSFDDKLERFYQEILSVLDPAPLERERKFALTREPDLRSLATVEPHAVEVTQIFLTDEPPATRDVGSDNRPFPTAKRRVRHHREPYGETFMLTVKRPTDMPGTRIEQSEPCDRATFDHLVTTGADPARLPVVKTRYHFAYAGRILALDHFREPVERWILEVELLATESYATNIELPTWLGPVTDVSTDPAFSNAAIARKTER